MSWLAETPHRRRLALLAACLGPVCATLSCAALLGFEPLSEEGAPDAPDAQGDGFTEHDVNAPVPTDEGCGDLGIPAPPDGGGGGASVGPIVAALRILDFGMEVDGGGPTIPGLNLDRTCSTDVATSSCTFDLLPSKFEKHAKDKNRAGLDNAGYGLIQFIGAFSDTFDAEGFNRGIKQGQYGAVIRISDWNGQPNDGSIRLEVFPSLGLDPHLDGGLEPRFDENDVWRLDKRFQLGGAVEGSNIVSDNAWVTNGRLVARFGEVILPLRIDDDPKPFDVRIKDAIVTGTIGTDVPLSDGVIAGRWKTSDFLDQVKKIYLKKSLNIVDKFICDSEAAALYSSIRTQVCEGRDLRADSRDNQRLPCDAVSAGARIETYRVSTIGKFVESFDGGPRCVTDSAVPENDDCDGGR